MWELISQSYTNITKQGSGSFGVVYKASCKKTRKDVAIKYIELVPNDVIYLKKTVSEIQILKKLTEQPNNIYTTKIYDLIVPETADDEPITWVVLVMDFVSSDLRTVLNHARNIELQESHVTTIMFNMLSATEFLHSKNLMHRDIKPANFLVDDEC